MARSWKAFGSVWGTAVGLVFFKLALVVAWITVGRSLLGDCCIVLGSGAVIFILLNHLAAEMLCFLRSKHYICQRMDQLQKLATPGNKWQQCDGSSEPRLTATHFFNIIKSSPNWKMVLHSLVCSLQINQYNVNSQHFGSLAYWLAMIFLLNSYMYSPLRWCFLSLVQFATVCVQLYGLMIASSCRPLLSHRAARGTQLFRHLWNAWRLHHSQMSWNNLDIAFMWLI